MKKVIDCATCQGKGSYEIDICDECQSDEWVSHCEDKILCNDCWAATLSDKEIQELC